MMQLFSGTLPNYRSMKLFIRWHVLITEQKYILKMNTVCIKDIISEVNGCACIKIQTE